MSHTVILELNCKPGLGASVLTALNEAVEDTLAFEGAELIEVYSDCDHPDRIVIWEKWAERANHEAYVEWREESGVMTALLNVVSEPPRFLHLASA